MRTFAGLAALAVSVAHTVPAQNEPAHSTERMTPVKLEAAAELEQAVNGGGGRPYLRHFITKNADVQVTALNALLEKQGDRGARFIMESADVLKGQIYAERYMTDLSRHHWSVALEKPGRLDRYPAALAEAAEMCALKEPARFATIVKDLPISVRDEVFHRLLEVEREAQNSNHSGPLKWVPLIAEHAGSLKDTAEGRLVLSRAAELSPSTIASVVPELLSDGSVRAGYEGGHAWERMNADFKQNTVNAIQKDTSDAGFARFAVRMAETGNSALVLQWFDRLSRTEEGDAALKLAATRVPETAVRMSLSNPQSEKHHELALHGVRWTEDSTITVLVSLEELAARRGRDPVDKVKFDEFISQCALAGCHKNINAALSIVQSKSLEPELKAKLLGEWVRAFPNDNRGGLASVTPTIRVFDKGDVLLSAIARHAPAELISRYSEHRSDTVLATAAYFLAPCKESCPDVSGGKLGITPGQVDMIRERMDAGKSVLQFIERVYGPKVVAADLMRDPYLARLSEVRIDDLVFPAHVTPEARDFFRVPLCRNLAFCGLGTSKDERQATLNSFFELRTFHGKQPLLGERTIMFSGDTRSRDDFLDPGGAVNFTGPAIMQAAVGERRFVPTKLVQKIDAHSALTVVVPTPSDGLSVYRLPAEIRKQIVEAPPGTTFIFNTHGATNTMSWTHGNYRAAYERSAARQGVPLPVSAHTGLADDLASAFKARAERHPELNAAGAAPTVVLSASCFGHDFMTRMVDGMQGRGSPLVFAVSSQMGQLAWVNSDDQMGATIFRVLAQPGGGTIQDLFDLDVKGLSHHSLFYYKPGQGFRQLGSEIRTPSGEFDGRLDGLPRAG